MPLTPEHTAQSGTQYSSSRSFYYVNLNSQRQHLVNGADTAIDC